MERYEGTGLVMANKFQDKSFQDLMDVIAGGGNTDPDKARCEIMRRQAEAQIKAANAQIITARATAYMVSVIALVAVTDFALRLFSG